MLLDKNVQYVSYASVLIFSANLFSSSFKPLLLWHTQKGSKPLSLAVNSKNQVCIINHCLEIDILYHGLSEYTEADIAPSSSHNFLVNSFHHLYRNRGNVQ